VNHDDGDDGDGGDGNCVTSRAFVHHAILPVISSSTPQFSFQPPVTT
jgi:hypothetical protein